MENDHNAVLLMREFAEEQIRAKENGELMTPRAAEIKALLEGKPAPGQTRADRIRRMDEDSLALLLSKIYYDDDEIISFCRNLSECHEMLQNEGVIDEKKCAECMALWLQQIPEEGEKWIS